MDLAVNRPPPFGISAGASIDDLPSHRHLAPGYAFILETVPRPHPSFELYICQCVSGIGVFLIRAVTPTIQTSSYGLELQSKFTMLREQLQHAYGPGQDDSYFDHNGIWSEPRYWLNSIRHEERSVQWAWESKATPLPNQISDIILTIRVQKDTDDEGDISLQYRFNNHEAAKQRIAMLESDVL